MRLGVKSLLAAFKCVVLHGTMHASTQP